MALSYRAVPAKSVSGIEEGIRICRKADYANGLNDEELQVLSSLDERTIGPQSWLALSTRTTAAAPTS